MYTKKIKSVLYLDDCSQNLMLFELMFSEDFDITCSLDPFEAIDLVKNNLFEIVISDYMMPIMDGIEFLNILRNKFPDIKRIMLTANSDPELEMEAREKCDLLEFLAKPLNYEEIKEILCETMPAN